MQDRELHQQLQNLVKPTESHISLLDEFVVATCQRLSAAENGQLSVRQEIAAELNTLVQKEWPGKTCDVLLCI